MSKSLQSFEGKIRSLRLHTQLADIAFATVNKICYQARGNGQTIAQTLGTTTVKHPQLNIPNESIDIKNVFATSRIKINEQALIELYAFFADYVSGVIREIEGINPNRILGFVPPKSSTNLSYKDIFTLGNYNAILDDIAKRVFRALDERSTPKLLKKFIKTAKLNVAVNIQQDALIYLEIRHLIIHNNSKVDAKFNALNNAGLVMVNASNKKVTINYALTSAAINAVSLLCRTLDGELRRVGLI
jgi:hypothetical protein